MVRYFCSISFDPTHSAGELLPEGLHNSSVTNWTRIFGGGVALVVLAALEGHGRAGARPPPVVALGAEAVLLGLGLCPIGLWKKPILLPESILAGERLGSMFETATIVRAISCPSTKSSFLGNNLTQPWKCRLHVRFCPFSPFSVHLHFKPHNFDPKNPPLRGLDTCRNVLAPIKVRPLDIGNHHSLLRRLQKKKKTPKKTSKRRLSPNIRLLLETATTKLLLCGLLYSQLAVT